jgi:hypothetical protein
MFVQDGFLYLIVTKHKLTVCYGTLKGLDVRTDSAEIFSSKHPEITNVSV